MTDKPKTRVVLYGAGGHGRVCLDIARAAGWAIAGFCDSAAMVGSRIHGAEVIANDPTELDGEDYGPLSYFPSVGRQDVRRRVLMAMQKTGLEVPSLIHPKAVVSDGAFIGPGTVIMPGAVIAIDSHVGAGCIVNHGATIDHDNQLGEGAKIGPGANLAGSVSVGAWANIGAGAVLIPGVSVGEGSVVGAGAVVIRDVEASTTVAGVPARSIY
ncbi:MAG: acetyltransferase [Pseudomonadota bacterium]